MLRQADIWEKEEKVSSGSDVGRIKESEQEIQQKLDSLITLYLDGEIPKENYLAKKDEFLHKKVSLTEKINSARHKRNNWNEPLREWILDMKKGAELVSSSDFYEIRDYLKKIGTNPRMHDKSVSVSFCPPTEFAFAEKTGSEFAHPFSTIARKRATDFFAEVSSCPPATIRT